MFKAIGAWEIGIIFFSVLVGLFLLYCVLRIVMKAGYNWTFGLLFIIPIVDIVALAIFAFETWPIQLRLREVRSSQPREQETPQVVPVINAEPKPVEKLTMNFCSSCGNRLVPGVKFCSNCGNKVV